MPELLRRSRSSANSTIRGWRAKWRRRPLSIDVDVADFDGATQLLRFERGIARLVLHEIDHLQGHLYVERLSPGADLIAMEDYQGTTAAWQY